MKDQTVTISLKTPLRSEHDKKKDERTNKHVTKRNIRRGTPLVTRTSLATPKVKGKILRSYEIGKIRRRISPPGCTTIGKIYQTRNVRPSSKWTD